MKKLHELTIEELRLVWDNNARLRSEVSEDMLESADFWITEYLSCWGRWDIAYDSYHRYFKVKDYEGFFDGLRTAQFTFCFLADEYNAVIDKAEKIFKVYAEKEWDLSEENFNRVEMRLTELVEELEEACENRLNEEYEAAYDDYYAFDHFTNFYMTERMETENFYVNDNYELFEHVEFERKYA